MRLLALSRVDRRVFRRTPSPGRTGRNVRAGAARRRRKMVCRSSARTARDGSRTSPPLTTSIAYDAVLLAVKAYSLDAAIPDFATAVGPETAIIPMLNGMRHIDILEERFGKEAVVGGVCKVAATIDTDGRIVQLAQFQELAYGERDGSVSPRMERLHDFMQGAGFDARLSRSIEYECRRNGRARHAGRDHFDARQYPAKVRRTRILHPGLDRS